MTHRDEAADREGTSRTMLIHRVIGRLNVGGPAMHVVNLARAMERHGFRTRLLVDTMADSEGDMTWYARERGVSVTQVPELGRPVRARADAVAFFHLLRWFQRERPQVVHTHTAKAGALGRVAAALAGVPVRVHTFHGHVLGGGYFGPRTTGVYRHVERQLARLTHRIVVLSERQKAELSEDVRVAPASRMAVIPLGLELDRFAELDREARRGPVRRSLGIGAEERVVGIVGRLVPIKNHVLLFHAVRGLLDRGAEPFRVLVVGGGSDQEVLRRQAAEEGIEDRVMWLGWRDDLPDLHSAMDVLALPSRDEGTPVAVIEAGAAGTPVVARDVGGVADVMTAGVPGRLVPAEDPILFGDALEAELRHRRAPDHEARHRVASRYSVARLANDLAELYARELGYDIVGPPV